VLASTLQHTLLNVKARLASTEKSLEDSTDLIILNGTTIADLRSKNDTLTMDLSLARSERNTAKSNLDTVAWTKDRKEADVVALKAKVEEMRDHLPYHLKSRF
jgi:chromosome segregation ATPase